MKRAIQTKISFDNFKRPRESISASSSAYVNVTTPVQLTSMPALPPTPVGEDAVSEGGAASPPTAKDAGTTSDEVNYGRWAWALFLLLDLVNVDNNISVHDSHGYSYSYRGGGIINKTKGIIELYTFE